MKHAGQAYYRTLVLLSPRQGRRLRRSDIVGDINGRGPIYSIEYLADRTLFTRDAPRCVLQCMLQHVAACCSVLQCVDK